MKMTVELLRSLMVKGIEKSFDLELDQMLKV